MQRLTAAWISGDHFIGSTFGDGWWSRNPHPSRRCFAFHQAGVVLNQPSTGYASGCALLSTLGDTLRPKSRGTAVESGRAERRSGLVFFAAVAALLTACVLSACGTAAPVSPATPQATTAPLPPTAPTSAASPTSQPTLAPSPTSPAPTTAPTSVPSPTSSPLAPTVASGVATATAVTSPTEAPAGQIGQRTRTAGCIVNGKLPDAACTPGAIIATATKEQICQPGYARNVRNVTTGEKDAVYRAYGITSHPAGAYEVDHLVSLELGGSNDIANLWPEAANPRPGFHEKDQTENYLHEQVCSGAITLAAAQQQIATNWLAVYQEMPKRNAPTPTPEGAE
jgi:hypothetical protein